MSRIRIYGILNVTPDSFSDGGKYFDADKASEHAFKMIEEGADVIDIGGMSTRPGFTDISPEEETNRVIPVIRSILDKDPSVVLSVDTFRASVAEASIKAGAKIINDITGLMGDPDMGSVIASNNVDAVLMRDGFGDPSEDWKITLQRSVDKAAAAGIDDARIILDPGVGFTKTREQDMELIRAIPDIIDSWGYPVLLGVSRKRITSEFYETPADAAERIGASLALGIEGARLGASILRVHDVKQTRAALNIYERMNGDKDS